MTDSAAFPMVFALAVLLLFNPLRTRVQGFVDRVFFGTRYDGKVVLAEVGAALAQARQRDQIATIVRGLSSSGRFRTRAPGCSSPV